MKTDARARISNLKQKIDELNAINLKLEESRKSVESVGVSLRLLETSHPLPIMRPA